MIRLPWIFFALTSIGAILTVTAAPAASPPPSTSVTTTDANSGTTIVGEQDSAMGLYLMPWKEEYASGMEQPPALLNVPPVAIDGDSLRRKTEYRDTTASYRRSHFQGSP